MVSSKNAAFIVTPVFDKHYASFEEVFFSQFFINTNEIVVCLTLHLGIDQYFGKKASLQKKHKVEQRLMLL
jgi:hypothetical protein